MSPKLNYFKNKDSAEKLHSYLIGLPNVIVDDSAKAASIGYYVEGQKYKFATLVAASYQSLVLHVDPGERSTELGKVLQEEVQMFLEFDIRSIRKHTLKANEVYIPLEKLDGTDLVESIRKYIEYAYRKRDGVARK